MGGSSLINSCGPRSERLRARGKDLSRKLFGIARSSDIKTCLFTPKV